MPRIFLDAADKAIGTFGRDASKPAAARNCARQIIQAKDKVGIKQRTEALAFTEAWLRQKRWDRMKEISDESLIDLDDYTMMVAAKRK